MHLGLPPDRSAVLKGDGDGGKKGGHLHGILPARAHYQSGKVEETSAITTCSFSA